MKTAVKTILVGKERVFNPRFLQMCSHHLFEPIACTPGCGWEKGQVENQVGTGRCNFFTPLVKVSRLEELNAQLAAQCMAWAKHHSHPEQTTQTVFEVYQQELPHLIPYRGEFESYKVEHAVVSAYSLVRYATNSYSVACSHIGRAVEIRIYANQIVVMDQLKQIGCHQRCFGRYQRIYDPWHYVPLLERKPGALRHGAPFKQLVLPTSLQKIREHLAHDAQGDKRFIRILLGVMNYGLATVEAACSRALSEGGCNDTVVLSYLAPCKEQKADPAMAWPLTCPPSEDCQLYNQVYLTQVTYAA